MIDFKNFKIKRGPSKDLHDPRLIVEEGYWYLSTDKAELFIGIIENGTPVLKPINGELIPEVNLEGYATEDFVREAIKNIDIPEVDLNNYYTKEAINELIEGIELKEGPAGKDGKDFTYEDFTPEQLEALRGPKGENGKDGIDGQDGKDFTYDMFTEEQLAALKGETGPQGPIGPTGPQGEQGPAGKDGVNGKDGADGKDGLTTVIKVGETTYEHVDGTISLPSYPSLDGYATEQYVIDAIADIDKVEAAANKIVLKDEIPTLKQEITQTVENTVVSTTITATQEWVNQQGYTNETKVLELIENNASSKIGIDFTTNITIGGLHAGTTITKDMTIGQLLYRMLYCEHDFIAVECGKPMICEYCGAEGPIAEHDPIINEGHEATCGSAGRTDEIYCGRCGEILEPAEEIPALEHIPSSSLDYQEEPTCTEVGYIKTRCELCGDVIDVQEVPALGHEFVDGICIRCGEVDPNYNPDQPEAPNSVVEEIISKELPMYSIDSDGNVTTKDFEVVTFNSRDEANQTPTESCFYQVKDENGEIIESGYQDMQIANDEMYYIIALPKSVDYNSNMVRMQAYDDEEQLWVECTKLPLTSDPEIVASCCDEAGVDISHINQDLYTVWVNEDTCTGSRLRYIIEE